MEEKVIQRRKFLSLRNALTPGEVEQKSRLIGEKVVRLAGFKQARTICSYLAFKKEVRTDWIIKEALEEGKRVSVPVIKDGKVFFLSEIGNIDQGLERGKLGIRQPKTELVKKIAGEEIDLLLVPGVAFDLKGYRLGWGKGYYDRFLAGLKKKISLVGLAYDFQVTERLPIKTNDVRVDKIVTERRIITINYEH